MAYPEDIPPRSLRRPTEEDIPTGGLAAPMADGSQNSMMNSDLARQAANTLRAIPGVGSVASTGGAISTALSGAGRAVDALGTGARAASAASSALSPGGDAPSTMAPPAGALRIRPEDAMAGPTAPMAPAGMPGTSDVARVGNSYSGGPNIRGDISVNGATPGGGAISAQNMGAADNLAARETLRGQALAMGSGGAQRPAQPIAMNSGNSWQARNDLRNLEVSAKSITNNGGAFDSTKGNNAAQVGFRAAQAADIASRGGMDAGSVARTNANAAMYGSDQTADAQRYGADQRLRGDMVQAGASRSNAQAQAALSLRKEATDKAERDRTFTAGRNDEANKRQDDLFKTMATGPDGKVDGAKMAELRGQSTAFLGEAIAAARRRGDTATAAKLEAEGPGAIGPQEMRTFLAAQKADKIAQQQNGRLPWNGDYRATDNPGGRTIVGRDNNLIWDMAKMSDGTRVPVNSLRYSNGSALSGINPWAVPTDEFSAIDPKGLLRR